MLRSLRVNFYIFREMLPVMVLGVLIFLMIMLMFQALRLTEFVLVHGVKLKTIVEIMGFLSISFLPAILPMSLLFAVLLTYGRLSADSEIVAFKSVGLSLKHLALPALSLGLIVAMLSAKVSFELAPWGNRQFELVVSQIGQTKASVTIREGVFSEGFFDLVVYANKVESETGRLKDVFIYNERGSDIPVTIIAREGQLIQNKTQLSQTASLRLFDGNIHRSSLVSNTKIDFDVYDINLIDPIKRAFKEKSLLSLNYQDLQERIEKTPADSKKHRRYRVEFHKRWGLAFGCLLFALLGVGLGTTTNRRNVRSGNMVTCLGLIVTYWVIYVSSETLAMKGTLPLEPVIWTANFLFLGLATWSLKRASA